MSNVMVCVTQQKTCDRLISRGSRLTDGKKDELFVIHVTPKSFGSMRKPWNTAPVLRWSDLKIS